MVFTVCQVFCLSFGIFFGQNKGKDKTPNGQKYTSTKNKIKQKCV